MPHACRLALVACLLALVSCATTASRAPVSVRLIAFNDFHGQINPPAANGGVASLAGLIGRLRAENPLNAVVAAGDLIGASPLESALFHDEPAIETLGMAGLEFSSVGNHEFDHGVAKLQRLQMRARFEYLAANVIDRATGRPLFPASAIKTFAMGGGRSLKIGFIGAVLKGVPNIVVHDAVKEVTFVDEADAINAAVAPLRAQGADVLVLLIHEGGETSQTTFDDTTCPNFRGALLPILDRLDSAIDVIISGHTHRTYICRRNGRLVTSAGSQGRYVTDVELAVDPIRRRVIDMSARQILVEHDPDPKVQAVAEHYTAAAAPLTKRTVASITADITREMSPARESALGDLIADAQLAMTSAPSAGGAQIAFMNSAGIRADLRAQDGRITYGLIYTVHPFKNALVTLTLSGAQIHELLEEQWAGNASLQVSQGFSYEWQASAAPGAKVDPASICLNGVPLDPAKAYRVTANEFLAGGGDGFTVLTSGTDPLRGPLDAEALEAYLRAHSPITPPTGGRIRKR